ncbi:MAG TPA: VCBS repeat-containing protein [Patescibacteria group bacterium]|nr:VCBS repeat-containing protein [Patescibacteria group bacterium]
MRNSTIILAAIVCLGSAPALAQTPLFTSNADWFVQGDQPTATFGGHLAPAGDTDGDGYDDVLVGDAGYDGVFTDSGRILLYRGSSNGLSQTPSWSLEGSAAGAFLSRAAGAGDVNGDGFDDIVVQSGQSLSLYLGSPAGPGLSPSWTTTGTSSGHGDVNGDGFEDLAVFFNPSFSIYMGSPAGLAQTPSTVFPLPLTGAFLIAGPVLDDFDQDGRDDLAYTWRYCGGRHCLYLVGELRVHLGSDKGLSTQAKRSFVFGRERIPIPALVGDADGDGFHDLAVTDYPFPGASLDPPAGYLLRGSRSGLRTQTGGPTIDFSGVFLECCSGGDGTGDINGDGFAEFHIAVQYPNTDPARTALLIYSGGPAGYSSVPLLSVEPDAESQEFGTAASRAGDVNGDGLGDFIVDDRHFLSGGLQQVGRVYAFYGRPTF